MIELYDMGRTTHKPVKGMYEFIVNHADKFVEDKDLAKILKQEAANRELPGHSISQEYFSIMCEIWISAYHSGDFPIDFEGIVYPDIVPRFEKVKQQGRNIGILTSASKDFTELLYGLPISDDQKLADLVDQYFLGEEIGDKNHPETFVGLWEKTEGGIYAMFDDKLIVCKAMAKGLKMAGGRTDLYLLDRKRKYTEQDIEEARDYGITRIVTLDEAR